MLKITDMFKNNEIDVIQMMGYWEYPGGPQVVQGAQANQGPV